MPKARNPASLDNRTLNIYADGSASPNPGPGGIGVVYVYVAEDGSEEGQDAGPFFGREHATNNEMELLACIEGLKNVHTANHFHEATAVIVRTDSSYVQSGYQSLPYWMQNGWRIKGGAPVQNKDLWKKLRSAVEDVERTKRHGVRFCWVKGHARDEWNQRADKLSRESRESAIKLPALVHRSVRRKSTKQSTRSDSITMDGRETNVRIIEQQKVGREWKLRIEVVDPDDADFGSLMFVYYDRALYQRYVYRVRLGALALT